MKNIVKYLVVLGLLAFVMSACSSDDSFEYRRWLGYGTVEVRGVSLASDDESVGGTGFDIRLDNGGLLRLVDNYSLVKVKNNDRIVVNFSMMHELKEDIYGEKSAPAVIYDLAKVLSKEPVLQSYIDVDPVEREEWLGNDPVKANSMWLGGKYLNVKLLLPFDRTLNTVHMINLVHDDVNISPDGVIDLYIRHNAYDDVPNEANVEKFVYGSRVVSFDLSSLLADGQDKVKIRVNWLEYGKSWITEEPTMEYKEGEFSLYQTDTPKDFQTEDTNLKVE